MHEQDGEQEGVRRLGKVRDLTFVVVVGCSVVRWMSKMVSRKVC